MFFAFGLRFRFSLPLVGCCCFGCFVVAVAVVVVFLFVGAGSSVFGRLAGTSAHCGSRPPGKSRLCNQLLGCVLSERIPIVFCIVGFCLVRPWRPPGGTRDSSR